MTWTKEILHGPWVGRDYASRISPRLLLLGESHHGDSEAVNMTTPVVDEWLSGVSNPSYRFFTHLAVAVSGAEPNEKARAEIFRRIAFYNYVQKVLPGPRIAPSADDFVRSEPAFREVIAKLRPTHIVVCGDRLWRNMPYFDPQGSEGSKVLLADREFHIGQYMAGSASPFAMCIRHPQGGFNGREWYPRLQAFLNTPL